MPYQAKHRLKIILYLLLLLIFSFQDSFPLASYTTRQSAEELPLLDEAPTLEAGQAIFVLNLLVQSDIFGLSPIIVNGIISLISQHVGIDPLNWHVRDAAAEDPSLAVYRIFFEIVVPTDQAPNIESETKTFVESGGLSDTFASQGVSGINFQVLDQGSGHAHGHGTQSPDTATTTQSDTPASYYNNTVDVSLLIETLPAIDASMEFSTHLDLYVQSPTIFFPPELRDAMKWFLGAETRTGSNSDTWFMTDFYVVNTTFGEYIATFVYVDQTGETQSVLSEAKEYIDSQALSTSLQQAEATSVNVTVLAPLPSPKLENVSIPDRGNSAVDILLRISAPINGLSQEVIQTIMKEGSSATTTDQSMWKLKAADMETQNGPFITTLGIIVNEGREVESVRNMTMLVRSKKLDHLLWNKGYTDLRVNARPRLTSFENGNNGSGPAIKSTAGTVAASVVGVVIVVLVGASILCLVPRDQNAFGSSKSLRDGLGRAASRKMWFL